MTAIISMVLIGAGTLFFLAGTIGLLRFPDLHCQLHALTKADGLGLTLIGLGAALLAGSAGDVARIALICAFAALSGATCGHLIARHARRGNSEARDV
ncbi:monovalent cation/H(+) antiporter subunit G [Paracoccus bogoriensis]|uniref:cation:proton antiporter n=1 Tax=Paracoccus bogoriensis TaxID=242065 RepID=UPI001C678DAA|nr:monovalent cation/H(+) antiporter subunit G [Paracoccus bogoriensis]MBW7057395.1 monovalent cation/H(+) antiporter subunit G [Paracoccus bogoriensis]